MKRGVMLEILDEKNTRNPNLSPIQGKKMFIIIFVVLPSKITSALLKKTEKAYYNFSLKSGFL